MNAPSGRRTVTVEDTVETYCDAVECVPSFVCLECMNLCVESRGIFLEGLSPSGEGQLGSKVTQYSLLENLIQL